MKDVLFFVLLCSPLAHWTMGIGDPDFPSTYKVCLA